MVKTRQSTQSITSSSRVGLKKLQILIQTKNGPDPLKTRLI